MFKLLAIYISLLTCSPGEELYAHYGHTAIRLQDTEAGIDWCFNYGTFSFNSGNFYWNFVRGETYYELSVEPTEEFFADYREEHREVYEQRLNLNERQTIAMRDALLRNCRPENREYLYNFVFDNCATRPYYLIKDIVGGELASTYQGWEGRTYREFIHHYTRPGTVMDFLINMIFGRRADATMHGEQRLFLPEELMFYLSEARLANGERLVEEEFLRPFVIKPVRWWESRYTYLALAVLLSLLLSFFDARKGRMTIAVDIVAGVIYALLIAIVVFLTYFSIHPLVGWNWRLLVIPAIWIVFRYGSFKYFQKRCIQ
ncbi:MAG: DUF4105 domain-containing protein [Paludibacteraceae bacterium]|nr:DUF4105 domain-containing protein [Paludibacteraceae bacterium]